MGRKRKTRGNKKKKRKKEKKLPSTHTCGGLVMNKHRYKKKADAKTALCYTLKEPHWLLNLKWILKPNAATAPSSCWSTNSSNRCYNHGVQRLHLYVDTYSWNETRRVFGSCESCRKVDYFSFHAVADSHCFQSLCEARLNMSWAWKTQNNCSFM